MKIIARMGVAALAVAVFAAGCATSQQGQSQNATCAQAGLPPLKVGIYADRGPGGIGMVEWLRLVEESPDMELTLLDGKDVREGKLSGLDLLVMPGGSSKTEYDSLEETGAEKLREFIRGGGGYIGTCAGCCLLMDGPSKRLNVIPWNTKGSEGDLLFPNFRFTKEGQAALGVGPEPQKVRYHGGPFMWPTTNKIAGANFELWGTFDAEATYRGKIKKEKQMYGAAAFVGGTYGKGRVFVTSAHPEYFDSTLYILNGAFKWMTGREVKFVPRTRRPRAISVGFLARGMGGKNAAETAIALTKDPDMDVVLIDKDGIFVRRMDNIDVLVVISDTFGKDKQITGAIDALVARGGKVIYCGRAAPVAPKGAMTCKDGEEAVAKIRKLFP